MTLSPPRNPGKSGRADKIAVIARRSRGSDRCFELLKRTDIHSIVCEATDAIGGIAQTYNYRGNRIEIGSHRFFSKSERVMNWWFNILPPQGAPAADDLEKRHEIDYAAEVLVEYLCAACAPELADSAGVVRRPGPDPEREDQVMLQRPRLSRIFYRRRFFPYPIGLSFRVARPGQRLWGHGRPVS